ncbi:Haloacid dehalogenase-like hydrolase motif-containing [Brazilian cedratvirus IHUMI]|uniref:Haloacid dehalogenase-like hydrolase motif-containing n=1 Tax=Brazilian cedratvirus IHUMI TaxID=2126980 RepID=A0A2R8FEF6_9VIRU|nr:Haloacid dehalogenase-like hydrolase motif-containing [Brazilian cedratvirus IHUMI]
MNTDGHAMNTDGHAMNTDGHAMNTDGHAMNTDGHAMNTDGHAMNTDGHAMNTDGHAMNTDGHAMNTDGHAMNTDSYKPVFVFDLDDTLVFYGKRGAKVPRETWHALRFLHEQEVDMYVISYNPEAYFIGAQLGLTRYIKDFITARPPRDVLLSLLLEKHNQQGKVVYFDDARDNLEEIRQSLLENITGRRIILHHVSKSITCTIVKRELYQQRASFQS